MSRSPDSESLGKHTLVYKQTAQYYLSDRYFPVKHGSEYASPHPIHSEALQGSPSWTCTISSIHN